MSIKEVGREITATAMDNPGESQAKPAEINRFAVLCDRIIEGCLLAIILLVPAIYSEITSDMFELPKSSLTHLLTIVALAAWGLKFVIGGELRVVRTKMDLPLIVYLALVTLSSLISVSPVVSFFGEQNRNDGLFAIINYVIIFFLAVYTYRDQSQVWRALKLITIVAAVTSLYGLAMIFKIIPVGGNFWQLWPGGRVVGTAGHPSFFSTYMGMIIPLGFILLARSNGIKGKLLWGLANATMILALVLSYGRSGWFGLGLAGLFLFFVLGWYKLFRSKAVLFASVAASLILFGYVFIMPVAYPDVLRLPGQFTIRDRLVQAAGGPANDVRAYYWAATLGVIKENWLIGVGVDHLQGAMTKFSTVDYSKIEGLNVTPDKAHNEYLQMAAESGVPALLSFLTFLGIFAWMVFRKIKVLRDNPLAAGLISVVIAYTGAVLFLFGTPSDAPTYWWAMGTAVAMLGSDGFVRVRTFKFVPQTLFANVAGVAVLAAAILLTYNLIARPLAADFLLARGDTLFAKNDEKAPDLNRYTEDQLSSVNPEHGSGHSTGGLVGAIDLYRQTVDWWPYQSVYWMRLSSALRIASTTAFTDEKSRAYLDESVSAMNEAIRLSPDHADLYGVRGDIYESYGQEHMNDSLNDFRMAVKLWPSYYSANSRLAKITLQLGYTAESIASLRKAVELKPDDWEGWYNLGLGYYSAKRYDEAAGALVHYVTGQPGDVEGHVFLGQVYFTIGKRIEAEAEMKRVLELDPNNIDAKDLLEQLQVHK